MKKVRESSIPHFKSIVAVHNREKTFLIKVIDLIDVNETVRTQDKRIRAYLLEHGENTNQLQVPGISEQTDNECFVELACSQTGIPGMAALRNLRDDIMEDTSPVSIHYGEFSININGEVDERQLAAVLRAVKNAD